MLFKNPVLFTLNSTFTVQKGIKLDIGVKDTLALKKGKGNPAAFYLYPAIGGGSTSAYATQFTQYLLNRNLMNNGDYPFAVLGNRYIKTDGNGNVSSIFNIPSSSKRKLKKIVDILGKETISEQSNLFIEIYDDGSSEKKLIIEK